MADKDDKFHDNVKGKFYVDRECIFCHVCSDAAPKNFKRQIKNMFIYLKYD